MPESVPANHVSRLVGYVKTRMQMATLWFERKPTQKNRIGEILEDLPVL
ncbi:MAG TPA: hypothetical protein VIJ25_03495 [Methylococcales bacterium]